MKKPNHIVLTTINKPDVLQELWTNLSVHGHLDKTVCWVVGDIKTPSSCQEICQKVTSDGLETHYFSMAKQDQWGKKFPEFYKTIPYNNETRRNIGYLKALENDCERLISIDDDNYPTNQDFIGYHKQTGKHWNQDLISDESGYFNICELLEIDPERLIFPRGFPFKLRGKKNKAFLKPSNNCTLIGVTAGLWLKEPDVDATTWLNGKVESIGYSGPEKTVLDQNTWTPINTQNTSIAVELIPAFLCIPMGHNLPGGQIERYGDIWGGYFLQALIKNTPYHVSFGFPLVEHRRNPHDYLNDLRHEYWGMMLTDWMLSKIKNKFDPNCKNISERVIELAIFIKEITSGDLPDWFPPSVKTYLLQTADTMHAWALVCQKILNSRN